MAVETQNMDWTQNINKYKYKEYFYFLTEENVNIKIVLPYFCFYWQLCFLYFGLLIFLVPFSVCFLSPAMV
jgi:hypothetical protein